MSLPKDYYETTTETAKAFAHHFENALSAYNTLSQKGAKSENYDALVSSIARMKAMLGRLNEATIVLDNAAKERKL